MFLSLKFLSKIKKNRKETLISAIKSIEK